MCAAIKNSTTIVDRPSCRAVSLSPWCVMPRCQPARKSDARSASALARASGLAPGLRKSFPEGMIADGPADALIFDLCAVNNRRERETAPFRCAARRSIMRNDSEPGCTGSWLAGKLGSGKFQDHRLRSNASILRSSSSTPRAHLCIGRHHRKARTATITARTGSTRADAR
jgi:hypothetical protein